MQSISNGLRQLYRKLTDLKDMMSEIQRRFVEQPSRTNEEVSRYSQRLAAVHIAVTVIGNNLDRLSDAYTAELADINAKRIPLGSHSGVAAGLL